MPQSYTNKDLNKPLTRDLSNKGKKYTNADLKDDKPPDIPDDIADAPPDIMDDENIEQTINAKPINENEPDTWMKGFINSVTSGDALSAGLSGAKGFAKGAIADLPSSIYHGIKNTITHPIDTFLGSMGPLGDVISGNDSMKGVRELSANAGNNPEEFGRMMGQMTGQPLVTAGMVKTAPTATRLSGYPVELLGKGLQKYPLSGWVPFARTAIPNVRRLDRSLLSGPIGKGIESVGKMMKRVGANEPITENMPTIVDGEELTPKNYKVIRNESTNVNKPKFRINGDGTFTNLETGEVLDSKGQSIVEINKKPILNQIKPKTVSDLIQNLEQTGNINLDSSINKLKSLDYQLHRPIGKSPGLPGLNDSDFNLYSKLLDEIKPQLPIELQEEWNNIVKNAKNSNTNLKPGDKVKFREPSKATSKPTLVDKNSPFFTRNRRP